MPSKQQLVLAVLDSCSLSLSCPEFSHGTEFWCLPHTISDLCAYLQMSGLSSTFLIIWNFASVMSCSRPDWVSSVSKSEVGLWTLSSSQSLSWMHDSSGFSHSAAQDTPCSYDSTFSFWLLSPAWPAGLKTKQDDPVPLDTSSSTGPMSCPHVAMTALQTSLHEKVSVTYHFRHLI